jgi:hypothetical protein
VIVPVTVNVIYRQRVYVPHALYATTGTLATNPFSFATIVLDNFNASTISKRAKALARATRKNRIWFHNNPLVMPLRAATDFIAATQ